MQKRAQVRRGADPDILAACREALAPVKLVILDGNYSGSADWWLGYVGAVLDIPASMPVADREEFLAALYHALDSHTDLVEAFTAFQSDERIELIMRDDNEVTSPTISSSMAPPRTIRYRGQPRGKPKTRPKAKSSARDVADPRTFRELLLQLRQGYSWPRSACKAPLSSAGHGVAMSASIMTR